TYLITYQTFLLPIIIEGLTLLDCLIVCPLRPICARHYITANRVTQHGTGNRADATAGFIIPHSIADGPSYDGTDHGTGAGAGTTLAYRNPLFPTFLSGHGNGHGLVNWSALQYSGIFVLAGGKRRRSGRCQTGARYY